MNGGWGGRYGDTLTNFALVFGYAQDICYGLEPPGRGHLCVGVSERRGAEDAVAVAQADARYKDVIDVIVVAIQARWR